jgi:hypothetical protein
VLWIWTRIGTHLDPNAFGCPGSGSVFEMRIWIRMQELEIDQNIQINLVSAFQKGFLCTLKFIYHAKIKFFAPRIRISIETNADPQHRRKKTILCQGGSFVRIWYCMVLY